MPQTAASPRHTGRPRAPVRANRAGRTSGERLPVRINAARPRARPAPFRRGSGEGASDCRMLSWGYSGENPGRVVERAPRARLHALEAGLPRRRVRGGGAILCLARGVSSDGMAGIKIHKTPRDPVEESRRWWPVAVLAMTRVVVLVLVLVRRRAKVGFKIDGEPLKEGAGREHTT
ncbi:hypothetical protein B0H17DRAFT_1148853 [Mycena rosella]|uniref:Uncharacterized protein n=1 Tax=Mycena rosella TaxID=1033263 RepID=A0AAD7C6Y6_MYCRO|nr:hypothetical protein B0H17DRAFT_1148853 [Mycena rosella]